MKKRIIPVTILVIIIFGAFIMIYKNSTDITDKKPTDIANLGGGKPKQILDAEEITSLKIDYSDEIPVEAILNNEPGYEQYYREMKQKIKESCQEFDRFELYGEEGCYLSTTSLRHFDTILNGLGKVTYALLFSADFEKRAAVAFYLNNDEITITVENSYLSPKVAKLMKDEPDELFIFLLNGTTFDSQISSNNILYLWSQVEKDEVQVKGDYFHSLDYKTLAVSYSMLTDPEHMIWIDFKS